MLADANKVIWITGASSGLGRSLTLKLAAQGHTVIATARNKDALEHLASCNRNIIVVDGDISNEDTSEHLRTRLETISPKLDQVILNAGVCEYMDFPNPDWTAVRRVMEVNFFGTVNCVKLALPLLRHSSQPAHIVAVASQATAAPFPRAEAYGASKAATQYFFDSLRLDLYKEGIDVTIVNPGFVDTPLTRKNDFTMPFLMDVDDAAERILLNIQKRPRHYRFPFRLSALLALSKCFPGLWQKKIATAPSYQDQQSTSGTSQ